MKTHPFNTFLATGLIGLALMAGSAGAATILKLDNTNSLSTGSAWTGGNAPGSGDIAQFGGTSYASTNAWYLGAATAWGGIQVLQPTNNLLTIVNDGNTLTLGASGINLSATTNTSLTINEPVTLAANQVWSLTNSRTITISGALTSSGNTITVTNVVYTNLNATVQVGNTGTSGSVSGNVNLAAGVTLAIARTDSTTPVAGYITAAATNCLVRNNSTAWTNTTTLNFGSGSNMFGGIINYSPGTLVLNGTATTTNYFAATNGLASTGPLHNANKNTNQLVINGGTWIVLGALNNNSSGSSGTTWSGTNFLTNCAVFVSDARYMHGVTYLQNGATFAQTNPSGSRISFDAADTTGAAEGFYVLPGGTLNCWADGYGFQLGSSTAGGYANHTTFIQQSGGLVAVGVNGTGANKNLLLGEGSGSATCYYNLSGGTLMVAGVLETNTSTPIASANSFNWTGGNLTVATMNMGNISGGSLTNSGGTFAPGGAGIPGRTTVLGNYVQQSGSLAVDLGGTTPANAFTNVASDYDQVIISGNATLGGTLNVNLINGFTPAANNAFTVLVATNGYLVGPTNFANNYNGYIPVSLSPLKLIQAVIIGNNLVLTNYGVTAPAVTASFTPTPSIGTVPLTVNFTDTSVGAISNRVWHFGNGSTLTTNGTAVSDTFTNNGYYTNILAVTDVSGTTSYATGIVHVVAASVNLTWKGDSVNNYWNTSANDWLNGATPAIYADPDSVTFDDTGSVTPNVNLTFTAQPGSVTFNNSSKNYTLAGSGGIGGTASINMTGSGNVTLLTSNSLSGTVTVNYGTTLQLGNGTTSGSLDSAAAITNNGTLVVAQPDNHTLNAVLTGYGPLVKNGAGNLALTANNAATFNGPIFSSGGTLVAASDNSLGYASDGVALTNSVLQYNSTTPFTLNRILDFEGTNDGLTVNTTVILANGPIGSAPVTLAGSGTVQVDQGGSSVSFPTNITLTSASLAYQRSDNFSQPGVIAGTSSSSSISTAAIPAGNTNTLTFASGINVFGNLLNNSAGELDLAAAPNSTNYITGTAGLAYAGSGALAINSGTFIVTNANVLGSSTNNNSFGSLILNGGTLFSSYANGNNGGSRHFKGNLVINGGTFHVTSDRLSMDDTGGSQSLTLASGSLLMDNSSGGGSYGIRFGNDGGSPGQAGFNFTGLQTGGLLVVSNSNITLGGVTTNRIATYTLAGGTAESVGTLGGLILSSDTNGTGSTAFILTNTPKLTVLGTINGGTPSTNSQQILALYGGSLTAETIDTTYLRANLNAPVGTLVNAGTTLLPGDTNYPGKLTIIGNYVSSNTPALGIEIGGTTAASAGQETINTNRYDNILVNGSATLTGNLNLTLINGFEPVVANNSSFTILTATNGVSGTFANLSSGRVHLVGDTTRSFAVTITATNVVLNGYQTPTPQSYFTFGPGTGAVPVTVTFTNQANGSSLTNLWNFGDGTTSTSTATTVTHTYATEGTNTVSLTVGNSLGSATYTVTNAVAVTVPVIVTPVVLTNSISGSTLTLSWPAGWTLQAQTNNINTGLTPNWYPVTGATSPLVITIDPSQGTVFYQLVHP